MLRRSLTWEKAARKEVLTMAAPSILYMMIYLLWWGTLERMERSHYTEIYSRWDDAIPFVEFFFVAYAFWFVYVTGTVLFFLLRRDREDYYRLITFLFTGMTIFLIVSTLFPNTHHLRPASFARDNVFTRLVAGLYRIDTPTNLWPSIHVYNAAGTHIAIARSAAFHDNKGVKTFSLIGSVSIILSTLFIKQHSVFDVVTGLAMAAFFYLVVYRFDFTRVLRHERVQRVRQ